MKGGNMSDNKMNSSIRSIDWLIGCNTNSQTSQSINRKVYRTFDEQCRDDNGDETDHREPEIQSNGHGNEEARDQEEDAQCGVLHEEDEERLANVKCHILVLLKALCRHLLESLEVFPIDGSLE